jgi:hypothetical protein
LYNKSDKESIIKICEDWCTRTRMEMDYIDVDRVIQKDVNNYIIRLENGKVKSKGGFVKKLSRLDNDLPIVNEALMQYFINNVPVEKTIMECNELIKFQKITKVSRKYDYASHNGMILHERVFRCFASTDNRDGTLYKKHKGKDTLDKTASTPSNTFIINDSVLGKTCPAKLDKQWYVDLAKDRIQSFIK